MATVSLAKAMWRGFGGKCPNCGEGHMFGRFLKVADTCDHCGEELFHQRADDFPAYLVMVVVGHLLCAADHNSITMDTPGIIPCTGRC